MATQNRGWEPPQGFVGATLRWIRFAVSTAGRVSLLGRHLLLMKPPYGEVFCFGDTETGMRTPAGVRRSDASLSSLRSLDRRESIPSGSPFYITTKPPAGKFFAMATQKRGWEPPRGFVGATLRWVRFAVSTAGRVSLLGRHLLLMKPPAGRFFAVATQKRGWEPP